VVEMGVLGEELRLRSSRRTRVVAADTGIPASRCRSRCWRSSPDRPQNGRDLEGEINRLIANSKPNGQPITLEDGREARCANLIVRQEPRRVKIEEISASMARQYNVSRADLPVVGRTAKRGAPASGWPIVAYLAKTLTLRSLPEIGRRFGGRDTPPLTCMPCAHQDRDLVGRRQRACRGEIEVLKRQLLG